MLSNRSFCLCLMWFLLSATSVMISSYHRLCDWKLCHNHDDDYFFDTEHCWFSDLDHSQHHRYNYQTLFDQICAKASERPENQKISYHDQCISCSRYDWSLFGCTIRSYEWLEKRIFCKLFTKHRQWEF